MSNLRFTMYNNKSFSVCLTTKENLIVFFALTHTKYFFQRWQDFFFFFFSCTVLSLSWLSFSLCSTVLLLFRNSPWMRFLFIFLHYSTSNKASQILLDSCACCLSPCVTFKVKIHFFSLLVLRSIFSLFIERTLGPKPSNFL